MAYSEFELIECREIIKDQKSQLTCLQRLVDAAVKEKQMIPPTLVIDAASLPQASRPIPIANEAAPVGPTLPQELEERLSHLSSMVSRVSSRLQEGADTSNVVNHLVSVFKDLRTKLDEKMVSTSRGSAEPGGDFVSLDANHVKLMVASDTIPAGGLSLLQFTKSYLDSTRGRVESTMHPRVLTVGSKYFTIREDGDNRLVLYKFHQWDCAAVWDEMEGQIVLRCKAGGDASSAECHVLNFGSADQFQRGFYALQYAGVIPANQTPGEYRDVASNDYAFSVVLMAPQLCPQLEGSRFATADCTLESLRGQLVIKIYNGQTVCHVDPSECILQCDSRSQCYKLWVPEPCAREICGGAPDDGDSNELIPLTCVFVKPSQGYPQ
ncbi:hypothetical protein GNI_141090 [Gregarina niphandrodes]|uniref:Uncharacterized protein n=1 Tax=Gregarina niphandrodes TaxID=110365 RepID=A0A023B110_GRENI|nr:hypothetical protein GNI_141090 [Gregarina niphandrodes]EZG45074.1 hypothetical protein GNI_141090 [Gregarina niphandrodes]|eukprot:XP_011132578.1 hypothetical protein GNI_141090 [Gregarina niphandrodes]